MTDYLQPVGVTVIGTGEGTTPSSGYVTTPQGQPDLIVTVIGPIRAISIRFMHMFLTILVALIGTDVITNLIPASDFMNLVWECSQIAITGAVLNLLKDLITIFGRLEGKYPLLTGSV